MEQKKVHLPNMDMDGTIKNILFVSFKIHIEPQRYGICIYILKYIF